MTNFNELIERREQINEDIKNAISFINNMKKAVQEMIEKNLIMESDLEPHRRAYAKSLRETYSGDAADIMLLELMTQHEKVKEVT